MHRRKVPVTILTGFLGAGKTTLLNYILTKEHKRKIAVIENEFGSVGVDDALLVKNKQFVADEQIFEMNNGCICCKVRGDVIETFKKIKASATDWDAIVIEMTGLGDPGPLCQTFFVNEEVGAFATIDAVIAVIDAKHILLHIDDEHKSADVVNEAAQQCAFADRLILNKIDLVTPAELKNVERRLREINTIAPIIKANLSKECVPLDAILGIDAFNIDNILASDPQFLDVSDDESSDESCHDDHCEHDHHHHHHDHDHDHDHDHHDDDGNEKHHRHSDGCKDEQCKATHCDDEKCHDEHCHEENCRDQSDEHKKKKHEKKHEKKVKKEKKKLQHAHESDVASVGVRFVGPLIMFKVNMILQEIMTKLGAQMFRYKGVLDIKGMDQKFVFQGVHMMVNATFTDEEWPAGPRENRACFIGRKLDRDWLVNAFRDAVCDDKPLRFKSGDEVYALVARGPNGWRKGKVIAVWDEGNPYRIALDESGTQVHAPVDTDHFVRAPSSFASTSQSSSSSSSSGDTKERFMQ